ncbi:cyclodeaminase/cyclohydrolase family protein [Phenylobacterium sp.]|jgi:formiminotetrahydrofolate cyclodeaminase|uniref:cyclodeaminase/cyclohydrolase family protein n=1 Tax=Phenylobacterium sp. TaxID=1871053 RepID=UPI002E379483|nr:cyclodeaminase/cyclohydrolase family protein [Phenylobacterium sp.]HEX2560265.1 cyclodeaminase/cyclohydrolase family protein [Phenylobacterium sp.]
MEISSASLDDLLSAVAADRPAPGAGAAAAVAVALGAACASKALRISGRRSKDVQLTSIADAAENLALQAAAGAQEHCEDFPDLLAAPHDPRAQRRVRADGEATLDLCQRLRAILDEYGDRVVADLAGDVAAAAHLIDAAESIVTRNLAELGSPGPL